MTVTFQLILRLSSFLLMLQVKTLSFDQSGTYLAVGGSEIQ